jgi:hypothetical protein
MSQVIYVIEKNQESGIDVCVDTSSLEVIVRDKSKNFSNEYQTAISNKSLFDNKLNSILLSDNEIKWLKTHKKLVESLEKEKIHQNKCPMPSEIYPELNTKKIKCIEVQLKEHGYTNKMLNDLISKI